VTRRSVYVHIEELVLHGFPPLERHALRDAVERELAALVAAHGVPAAGAAGAVAAGSFDAASLGPADLAAGIAASVGGALGVTEP
jgi:hypothetical protein